MMYEPGLRAPSPLSRRQRAVVEHFRRIGNVIVPAIVILGIATVAWITARTIAAAGQSARPMSAAVEARATGLHP